MRIFKNREFSKWATGEGVADCVLRKVVAELERGLTGVNLGGQVFKKRVAMNKSILEVIHEDAKDLYEIGLIDEQKMREFDALCLPPEMVSDTPQDKRIRPQIKPDQRVSPSG